MISQPHMASSGSSPGSHIKPIYFLGLATAILILAAIMRFAWLRDIPPGLAQDEVLNADIVRFIWQGKHTFFFREGYGHEPLYHYLAAPFQPLLGDNLLSIRLPAGFIGLLLVAAVMRWSGREYGRRVALLAGTLVAISWWPIVFSRIGIRPILEPLLLVGAVYFWPYPGRAGWRRTIAAGIFLGLSLYSYTAAQIMLLLPPFYLVYLVLFRWWKRRQSSTDGRGLSTDTFIAPVVTWLIAGLIFVPMLLTWRADPTLLQRVEQLSGPLDALRAGNLQPILSTTAATLGVFAVTGDPRMTYMLSNTPLFGPVAGLLFGIGLLIMIWRALANPAYGLALVWLMVGLVPSAVTPQAPSTVRLVGLIPVVYLLPAIAVDAIWRRSVSRSATKRSWKGSLAVLLTLILLGAVVARTIRDGFVRWPNELETRLRYQTVFRDMAAELNRGDGGAPVLADSFFEPIDHDSVRRNLGGDLEARWVQPDALVFPAGGGGKIYLPEYASFDSALLEAAGIADQPLYRSAADPAFAVYDLPDTPRLPDMPAEFAPVTFGDAMTLLGYQRLPQREDRTLPLLTWWRVETPLPIDLAIFTHVVDADGLLVAQDDGLDAGTFTLQPGDRILQFQLIELPVLPPNAILKLETGLYRRENGVRLPHPGTPFDRLLIDMFRIDDV